MTDDSEDQQKAPRDSTQRAADLLKDNEHDILNLWIDAVSNQVPGARHLGRVEIGDHLHELFSDMVNTLTSLNTEACSHNLPSIHHSLPSALHGRERATLKEYTPGQVVHEYAVLRRVVTHFFQNHGLEDVTIIDLITCVIEFASLNAVNEFVEAMQETQQKLISTLVHDVRTPLGVASTYVELLSRKGISDQQKALAVKTTRGNLSRAVGMLEELLDSAKPVPGNGLLMRFEEVDINLEVSTLCIEATNLYERKINFSMEDHPVIGVFDTAQIVRTLENLISNAVKFGDKDAPIDIYMEDNGDHVAIRVHNEGDPIPTEEFDGIFAFFSRTGKVDKEVKGWGLGLALIKTIATSHGGKVIFESSETAGTTFGMTLQKHFRRAGDKETILL